ncbi:MAG: hypothetical protein U0790_21700 [Isosphaeraceae bacterium]
MSAGSARHSPIPELDRLRADLGSLYRELDEAVARHQPTCELSGRCCRFKEYDHMLFLSEPEATLLVADAPPPSRGLDAGATCPWQDHRGRCTAREARPLGCRVFFCDPDYAEAGPVIAERFIFKLKQLAESRGWAWNYAPLHRHLERARDDGRLHCPDVPEDAISMTEVR